MASYSPPLTNQANFNYSNFVSDTPITQQTGDVRYAFKSQGVTPASNLVATSLTLSGTESDHGSTTIGTKRAYDVIIAGPTPNSTNGTLTNQGPIYLGKTGTGAFTWTGTIPSSTYSYLLDTGSEFTENTTTTKRTKINGSDVVVTNASGETVTGALAVTGTASCAGLTSTGAITATGQTIASGTITSTGLLTGVGLTTTGPITATGQTIGSGAITSTGLLTGVGLTTTGAITATGQTVACGAITSSGAFTCGTNAATTGNLGCGSVVASGNITCGGSTINSGSGAITAVGNVVCGGTTINSGSGALSVAGPFTATGQTVGCGAITSTGAFTCGTNAATTGALSCGAITTTGALTATNQTIGCGAITSTGAFSCGTNAATTGALGCGAITSSGAFTCGTNGATTGALSCGAITTTGALTATGQTINAANCLVSNTVGCASLQCAAGSGGSGIAAWVRLGDSATIVGNGNLSSTVNVASGVTTPLGQITTTAGATYLFTLYGHNTTQWCVQLLLGTGSGVFKATAPLFDNFLITYTVSAGILNINAASGDSSSSYSLTRIL